MKKEMIVVQGGFNYICRVETFEKKRDYNDMRIYYHAPKVRVCLSILFRASCFGSPPRQFNGYMNRESVKEHLMMVDFHLSEPYASLEWMDDLFLSAPPTLVPEIDLNNCHVMWSSPKGFVDLSVLFHENNRSEMELYLRFMGASTPMIGFLQNCTRERPLMHEPVIMSYKQLDEWRKKRMR